MNDRARVPFALVGVLLLVGSAALSGGLAGVDPVAEPSTEAAMEEARTALGGDLRDATRAAAREAAAAPVVTSANTTLGRALAASEEPFRTALALRAYLAVRERLDTTSEGGVTVSPSLPELSTAADLRRALDRTTVERVGANGTAVRVTVENVTLTARRDGRVAERVEVSPSVSVATPVLLFHERAERFDRRLDAGATEPGLARRTTGRLYALAWGRGVAQYGGAPIANVVANRHVAVAVNHALLAEQRAAFGAADDAGVRATRTAAARAAGTDLLAAAGASGGTTAALIEGADRAIPNSTLDPNRATRTPTLTPESTVEIGVDATAESAFRSFTDGELTDLLAATYRVRADRQVRVTPVAIERSGRREPPGENWTLVDQSEATTFVANETSVPTPDVSDPWHVLGVAGRTVTERRRTERRWRRGNETRVTVETVVETSRVRIVLRGRHDGGPAAERAVVPVHEPGGSLDGPNLAAVKSRVYGRLVADRGGAATVARRAVTDDLGGNRTRVRAARADGLREWVYRDLVRLRERVRNVSIAVERGRLGTYTTNPAARLATAVRERRDALVDAPDSYDGVADRARIAARTAYLDAVLEGLERRAQRHRSAADGFAARLAEHGLTRDRLAALVEARDADRPAQERRIHGVTGERALVVEGAPAYLTLERVSRRATDARGDGTDRSLVARNLNLFTVPYADAADTVVGALFGPDRVRLRSAARALRAANRVAANTSDPEQARRRAKLSRAVEDALAQRRRAMRNRLAEAGVGSSPSERRAVVGQAFGRWNSTTARALAVANDSAADRVLAVAERRYPNALADPETRDRLRLALRAASDGSGVRESAVNASVAETRRVAKAVVSDLAATAVNETATAALDRVEKRLGRSLARVPAGLPLTPVPSQWYATSNVWVVSARGSYDRFAVRARDATPGTALTYVRDGSSVTIDWDEDGDAEAAGRASEVDLTVETAVVVVVPPGGQGVGDTDGNADERSAGWNDRGNSKALNPPPLTAVHVPRSRRRAG